MIEDPSSLIPGEIVEPSSLRFAPRLRDLSDRRLYVVDRRADHGTLNCLIGGAINFRRIEENWDETLRMTASIRAGTVAPSVLMRRLAAYPRQNALARALREIGCLERTLFILDWISDPALRRRSNAGLNKGEARNSLARALFFHRHGEIRDRTFENQRYRASGLNLTIAAIVLWNTIYLSRAVAELRAQSETLPDKLLAHIGGFCISPRKGSIHHFDQLENDPLPLPSVFIENMHVVDAKIDAMVPRRHGRKSSEGFLVAW
jgi:TnpA family transposase